VAREAGVSVATVSRAMRGMAHVAPATRDKVVEAASRLGWAPHFAASRLASGQTHTIGLVAPYFDIWYTSQIVAGVESILSAGGLDLVIYSVDTPANRQRFLDRAHSLQTRIDGLVLVDFFPDATQIAKLEESRVRLLALGEHLDNHSSMAIDNFDAGRRAAQHLIGLSHKKIGIVGAEQMSVDASPVLAARIDGFHAALTNAGINHRREYSLPGMLSVTDGPRSIRALLELEDPPTALFYLSDETAIGAMGEARRRGLSIPGDLSIIGFDDHDLSDTMQLTTMRQPVRHLGALAAERMLEASVIGKLHETIPVELVLRESTGQPR
jgi:LacI family transcriptional regulator, repressor for deo operon, udp, cdd, tsx, nupC, and nupG